MHFSLYTNPDFYYTYFQGEQGGEVDCIISDKAEQVEGRSSEAEDQRIRIKQLRHTFEEIRTLESKARQIEDNKS